ncbi:MAG: serine/threonine protein kinase [Deltaproteobacteria bacterium]|nr:serine/threonine protein kinase [Deltaproteobacteria bacterium]
MEEISDVTTAPGRADPPLVEGDTDPEPAEAPALFGPIELLGRHALLHKLATGGMAEIWLAKHVGQFGFQRLVAVKRILPHLAVQPAFRRMFLDEVRTSTQLTHPNIVQVHEFGEVGNVPYMSMELVVGEPASALQWRAKKATRPIGPALGARIVADAAKALHYAHHFVRPDGTPLEIVHRDISPQNLLISYEGVVKVVDFGIAKAATNSERTSTGTLKGKFSYMSPEQCRAEALDKRSDVFALGVVLYELVTGTRLYKHESELMLLEMITKGSVVAPSTVAPGIDPRLDAIVMKAIEKNRALRYQTALELRVDLEDWLQTQTQGTNEDLAELMKALFAKERAKKQAMLDRAARIEPPAPELPLEALVQSAPIPAPVFPPTPAVPFLPFEPPPLPPTRPPERSAKLWPLAIPLLIALATLVIFLLPTPQPNGPQPPQERLGAVAVESVPPGAIVIVDGKRLPLGEGWARTPLEKVTGLGYGRTYELRLEKEGYRPFSTKVTMSEAVDATSILARLEVIPATLIVETFGVEESEAPKVHAGSIEVGHALRMTGQLEPGTYKIWTDSRRCQAEPEQVEALPGATIKAVVTCTRDKVRVPDPPKREEVVVPACALTAGANPGRLNIDTVPVAAQIYYGDKHLGETPLALVKLPAGCLMLRAVNQEAGFDVSRAVTVQPNTTSRFRWDLAAK